ncbi:hypothetical protein [Streptomyces morookaense]|uniref:Uncharacterized protein n=1 Tax=Streptomyces morookaense TaxID=1970 RepID=A0A7Y7E7H2_STRMO|nr:hypothetical protein [Streptomyces morookaense]NVK78945.1 hypothetical protein [Streptomyces morookaense]
MAEPGRQFGVDLVHIPAGDRVDIRIDNPRRELGLDIHRRRPGARIHDPRSIRAP